MIIGLRAAAPGVLLAGVWIGALLYADDLVIISESPEEMQRMLDCFAEWCAENNQDPNIKKTHMVFMDVDPAAHARRQEAEPRLDFTLPPRREGECRLTIQEKDGYKYQGWHMGAVGWYLDKTRQRAHGGGVHCREGGGTDGMCHWGLADASDP